MPDVTHVVNPTTEQVVAEVPIHGVEATDEAVARARAALPGWQAIAPADRARMMRRFAAVVEEHHEELAQLETANVGKPIGESRDEVGMVAEVLYFYAGAVDKHRGATVPVAGGVDMTFHEPLGVVGAIIPWNFPIAITSWKVGPALATGNTIVVKPAEITPLTALRLAELGLEAGLPEGVLQVVTGRGSVVGTRLAEHPDVAKVAFTGSTEVGRDVMTRASGTIKRVTLELGGKSASVVFADADLAKAAASAPGGMFANAGQDCCARSRILVQRPVLDEFLDLLADAVAAWTVGDPTDESVQDGPAGDRRPPGRGGRVPGGGDGAPGGPVPARTAGPCPTDRATGSPRPWWPRPTRAGAWPARRSSGRSSPSSPSTTRRTPSAWPTTPRTGCRGRSGPGTAPGRCGWPGPSRPATCRSTPTARCGSRRASGA